MLHAFSSAYSAVKITINPKPNVDFHRHRATSESIFKSTYRDGAPQAKGFPKKKSKKN